MHKGRLGPDAPLAQLTGATAEAIDSVAEKITKGLLEEIDVGYATEVGAGRQAPDQARRAA